MNPRGNVLTGLIPVGRPEQICTLNFVLFDRQYSPAPASLPAFFSFKVGCCDRGGTSSPIYSATFARTITQRSDWSLEVGIARQFHDQMGAGKCAAPCFMRVYQDQKFGQEPISVLGLYASDEDQSSVMVFQSAAVAKLHRCPQHSGQTGTEKQGNSGMFTPSSDREQPIRIVPHRGGIQVGTSGYRRPPRNAEHIR